MIVTNFPKKTLLHGKLPRCLKVSECLRKMCGNSIKCRTRPKKSYYVKSSTLSNQRKENKGHSYVTPQSAILALFAPFWPYLRHFGPIFSWAPDETAPYFFSAFDSVYDFTYIIIYQKIKEIGPCDRKLCRFENTPGHLCRTEMTLPSHKCPKVPKKYAVNYLEIIRVKTLRGEIINIPTIIAMNMYTLCVHISCHFHICCVDNMQN